MKNNDEREGGQGLMFEYSQCPICEADMFSEVAWGVFECGQCFAVFGDDDKREEDETLRAMLEELMARYRAGERGERLCWLISKHERQLKAFNCDEQEDENAGTGEI
jgi:ribosomal protein L37AE/L43A